MKTIQVLGVVTIAMTLSAAAGAQQSSSTIKTEPTTATQNLLQLQRSGALATQDEQHLDGKVRSNIYKRYVESFSHPIPDRLTKDSFTAEE